MTKMATSPIYDKTPSKIFFSRTRRPITFGLTVSHLRCGAYQVCSNDGPKLTMSYLTSRSNLLPNVFKNNFFKMIFLKTVEAKVNIITRYVQFNETVTINKFQR